MGMHSSIQGDGKLRARASDTKQPTSIALSVKGFELDDLAITKNNINVIEGRPIPPKRSRTYKIITPKVTERLELAVVGESILGVDVHYSDRTVLHRETNCAWCASGLPIRWSGYIAVLDVHRRAPAVLALTPSVAQQLMRHAETLGQLRGLRVALRRYSPSGHQIRPNSPVRVEVLGIVKTDLMPASFPVLPSVKHVLEGVNLIGGSSDEAS